MGGAGQSAHHGRVRWSQQQSTRAAAGDRPRADQGQTPAGASQRAAAPKVEQASKACMPAKRSLTPRVRCCVVRCVHIPMLCTGEISSPLSDACNMRWRRQRPAAWVQATPDAAHGAVSCAGQERTAPCRSLLERDQEQVSTPPDSGSWPGDWPVRQACWTVQMPCPPPTGRSRLFKTPSTRCCEPRQQAAHTAVARAGRAAVWGAICGGMGARCAVGRQRGEGGGQALPLGLPMGAGPVQGAQAPLGPRGQRWHPPSAGCRPGGPAVVMTISRSQRLCCSS
jgi:hypothetical protein